MAEEKLTAATRLEKILDNIAGGDNDITPATRLEKFLSYIADAMEGGGGSGGGGDLQFINGNSMQYYVTSDVYWYDDLEETWTKMSDDLNAAEIGQNKNLVWNDHYIGVQFCNEGYEVQNAFFNNFRYIEVIGHEAPTTQGNYLISDGFIIYAEDAQENGYCFTNCDIYSNVQPI